MIFISVLLPAPFSPSTAWISPGRTSRSTLSFAITAGIALGDAAQDKARLQLRIGSRCHSTLRFGE